ncbi:MAG: FecR domain-containing protein [Bacteroidales bacterium]
MSSDCNEIRYSILKKYFEGKASEEEKESVTSWLTAPERNFKLEECMRRLWKEMDLEAREPETDLNMILDKIHHDIHLKDGIEKTGPLSPRSRSRVTFTHVLKNLARVAAILLVPLLGYFTWELYSQRMWMKNQSDVVYHEIICPLGLRSQFQLPDGTTVSLNNGSRLKYPVRFSNDSREVELIGEAYFDVTRDKKRPFFIKTAGLDIKVLGTRLNVYSYPDEGFQEFTLEYGTIELIKRGENQDITVAKMKPGQHLVYSFEDDGNEEKPAHRISESEILDNQEELHEFLKRTDQGHHAKFRMKEGNIDVIIDETEQYTAWKDNKLVLRNDPMNRLLKRTERWYNVKFNILDESISEYTYWATFEEENLEQVLALLELTSPIKFIKKPREKMEDGTYKVQEIDVKLEYK